ncbi:hypothetical protein C4K68_01295 [Pokkaliibacter plantistimulans]|uniref:Uncharacterized protein n=1 Tax=Proteobacteria bacterium 228 TaxID=2083153 RepID=A0A2S5KXL6_9PROT|nr:hypothetical protein C4K68_01295 [Pokkaliibacter plantistimulans]
MQIEQHFLRQASWGRAPERVAAATQVETGRSQGTARKAQVKKLTSELYRGAEILKRTNLMRFDVFIWKVIFAEGVFC